ncbi:MAG: excinuclease ABC subunit UvrB [Candidatus Sungiibacteriota bacterium]|uniref:UvrABC system protein B n=1 Tax=Candidatus Sungiibacteriota bacterium TaxID=2750080 RepID=A0A7T5RIR5_9BACT|nr:MAG: excinuclease ABC subunit UvrB [Candidatus Sungbacteria bacterium]
MKFRLVSSFRPTGDQPQATDQLVANLRAGARHQTLLGVTGSGKTFTMANVVERVQKPTLVISHNKTLAAQLYQEFKEFFPENAVHYFVSYYDYYQPEAYIPQTDTYIEKDAKINEMIDALRHASTASLLTRNDVIIVASVSCIYGIGDPEEYQKISVELRVGEKLSQKELIKHLILLQYARNPINPRQGHFRVRENVVEIYLPSGEDIVAVEFSAKGGSASGGEKNKIIGVKRRSIGLQAFKIFPAKHFVTPQEKLELAIVNIQRELKGRLAELKKQGKILSRRSLYDVGVPTSLSKDINEASGEAARLKQRTEFDMEMLRSTGYVNGIENYSRQLDFRKPGTPPHTLIDYFRYAHGSDFLTFIDESHATVPQVRGMYNGDRARKEVLIKYGFRLPSALDNRPLKFEEFNKNVGQLIYVSATPALYEIEKSRPHIVEQLIRPTGILDPQIEVRPTKHQIKDVIAEIKKRVTKKERSLVMALTKRLAEDIAEYLTEAGIKAEYLHSEIKTLERPEILKKLREGEHDVLVGINLLREGLDLPEVSFIAILDADKEGFLRNETTLLQIIGRAARHIDGKVILYADTLTGSMKAAVNETNRRRETQKEYNRKHGITPQQIKKEIRKSILAELKKEEEIPLPKGPTREIVKSLEREMKRAAGEMDFELAARIRDRIKQLTAE